jgi:hypothetical protein
MIAEILNGELTVTPRPSPKHMLSASALGSKILPACQFGQGGGPGGWVIVAGVEVRLQEQFIAPDLAGWSKETFPKKLE